MKRRHLTRFAPLLFAVAADPLGAQVATDTTFFAHTQPAAATAPRFWGAVLDVTAINAATVLINVSSGKDFAQISPSSWAHNIDDGLAWDNNKLQVNQLGHPFHGSAYFNGARASGYGFWASAPFAVAGSLMWEFLGETHRPSTNDVLSTSLGGIILGETMRQLAVRVLDDEDTGVSRALREAAVALFNPGLGLHRLSRGEAWHTRPADGLDPAPLRFRTDLGARRISVNGALRATAQPVVTLQWEAGDAFARERSGPFDAFAFRAELSGYGTSPVSAMEVRAPLATRASGAASARSLWTVHTRYLYEAMPGLQHSEAEFGVAAGRRTAVLGGELDAMLSAGVLPLAAIAPARPLVTTVRRSYDYAIGASVRASLGLRRHRRELGRLEYQREFLHVLDGAAASHDVSTFTADLRMPLVHGLALGAAGRLTRQASAQSGGGTVHGTLHHVGLYLVMGQ